jgi:hypothetical protein
MYFFILANDFLHAVKSYEASSSASPPKEQVLQIFVVLENSSPRPGLTALTITQLRRLLWSYMLLQQFLCTTILYLQTYILWHAYVIGNMWQRVKVNQSRNPPMVGLEGEDV